MNNGMLELGLGRGGRATFGEQYSFGFVNVYSKFPFGEISVLCVYDRSESYP